MLAHGTLDETLAALVEAHRHAEASRPETFWLFDDARGAALELDFRGSLAEVAARVAAQLPVTATEAEAPAARSGPGRPRLGVIAREVTLLPQHWEWLGQQPGGASVALRKLVHAASKASASQDQARAARDAAHRVMLTLGGSLPGFEEASRALFKGDFAATRHGLQAWPAGVQTYLGRLLDRAEAAAKAVNEPGEAG
jgi:hypothetical protein